jgi:hypothetical protein
LGIAAAVSLKSFPSHRYAWRASRNSCTSFPETVIVGETAHDRVSDPTQVWGGVDADRLCARSSWREQSLRYHDTPWKGDLLFDKRWPRFTWESRLSSIPQRCLEKCTICALAGDVMLVNDALLLEAPRSPHPRSSHAGARMRFHSMSPLWSTMASVNVRWCKTGRRDDSALFGLGWAGYCSWGPVSLRSFRVSGASHDRVE